MIYAEDAYNQFAQQTFNWLNTPGGAHADGSLTSMISGFSRGGAAAAIFAQMLYEKGLIYTNKVTCQQTMMIPPFTLRRCKGFALLSHPVLTGVDGKVRTT